MPVIQPLMTMTDDAYQGLLSGDLVRYGGVIYNKGGGVFEHLKDMEDFKESKNVESDSAEKTSLKSDSLISKTITYVSENKVKASVIFSGMVLIGTSFFYGIHKYIKSKFEDDTVEVAPDTEFNESLSNYIAAANEGTLTLPLITSFKEQLNKISEIDESNIVLLEVDKLIELVGYIEKYTEDLARANKYQIFKEQRGSIADGPIINLANYLEIQEDIFLRAV